MDIYYNLKNVLPLTIFSAILTFVLGSIFTFTLIYCAGLTLWIFIFSVFLFSGLLGMVFFFRAHHWQLPILEVNE